MILFSPSIHPYITHTPSPGEQIASNARALHRLFVSRDGVLDYLQVRGRECVNG